MDFVRAGAATTRSRPSYHVARGPNPAAGGCSTRTWRRRSTESITTSFSRQLGTFPARELISRWLKAGVVENGRFTPTEEGTPQGGVVSPVLLNVALHGMEGAAGVRYQLIGTRCRCDGAGLPSADPLRRRSGRPVHYQAQAEQVKARLAEWLAPRGLAFNEDKTRIVTLDEGFDFLGFNVRRFGGKLLISPSKAALRRHRERLRAEMHSSARGQRGDGAATAQPHRAGVVGLLPDGGVQRDVLCAGPLRVEAHLQVGQAQPPEEVEALGRQPLLRQVQQVQARPLGIRRPRQRRLPGQVRLDEDRPTPDGQGKVVAR